MPPEHFDWVMVSNVLFSAAHPSVLVHEVRRVLKRHGRALVIDWRGSFGGLGPHPDHVVSERSAHTLFADAGFEAVSLPAGALPTGEYHWGLVMRKKS